MKYFQKRLIPFFSLICVLFVSVLLFNCERDEIPEHTHEEVVQSNRVQVNTHENVSKSALDFIRTKTNNSFKVLDYKGKITLANSAVHAKSTALGTVDTDKEIVVVNETNIKHTFKVINNESDGNVYTNLIVVETENSTYEYFLKYILNEGVSIHDAEGNLDFSQFQGRIETYNSEGVLIGDVQIENGNITVQSGQLAPCPDEPVDDTTNTNDEPTDGNDTASSSTSTGAPGSDSGSGTNNSSSNGGWFASSDDGGCGLSWSYAECGCGGTANGHAPSGPDCCAGSPLTITDCNGNVVAQGRTTNNTTHFKRDIFDPCDDGDVGVILDEEELCAMDNESFNNYYSERSPFTVDLSEIRKRCDTIDPPKPENEKFMCIYNKLIKSPKFKHLFVDVFGESQNLNVKFKIVDILPDANGRCKVNGQLDANGNIMFLNIEILIKKSSLNTSPRITVAKTIIHECIHAYLNVKKLNCNQGTTFDELNDKLLGELINEYFDGTCAQTHEQHEFMFDYMIPTMQTILGDVRDNFIPAHHQNLAESTNFESESNPTIPSTPWNWNDFYYNLSLQGLHNTQEFQQQILNDPVKKYFYYKYFEVGNQFSNSYCND